MKKILLSILLCGMMTAKISSQTFSFAFTQFTSAYTPLTSGTDLYGATPWNSNSIMNIPIGFTFNFMGQNETTLDMIPGIAAWPAGYDSMGVYAFEASVTDTGSVVSKSPVTYQVSGTAGNRILKIETKDAGFTNEAQVLGYYQSWVNFQLWLYESDNSIEVHIGPNSVVNPNICYNDSTMPGPNVGPLELNTSQTAMLYSLLLTGNPSAASSGPWSNFPTSGPPALSGTPADGTVYRFSVVLSGINEAEQVFTNVGLFPNPANENATLFYQVKNAGDVNMQITDMQGRIVANEQLGMQDTGTHNYSVNTSELSNGIYFVTLLSGEQKIVQKLNVAH
ncbi:MAG TPA: T9SS type A sorting domain-containing protein [Bacteroidia bacterium]|jgi:hypothetical protein|nr:T9SS type A sorting domain-containing protein [Bacteroidia bacterium]